MLVWLTCSLFNLLYIPKRGSPALQLVLLHLLTWVAQAQYYLVVSNVVVLPSAHYQQPVRFSLSWYILFICTLLPLTANRWRWQAVHTAPTFICFAQNYLQMELPSRDMSSLLLTGASSKKCIKAAAVYTLRTAAAHLFLLKHQTYGQSKERCVQQCQYHTDDQSDKFVCNSSPQYSYIQQREQKAILEADEGFSRWNIANRTWGHLCAVFISVI